MATSAVTLNVTDVNESRRSRTRSVKMTVAASPGTYPTGGWTVDLTTCKNPDNLPCAGFTRVPATVTLRRVTFGTYIAVLTVGTTLSNSKLQLFDTGASSGAAFAELTDATATPASVSSAAIYMDFEGPKNL